MEVKTKEQQYDVGVIIGRFQVPELHDAHKALINLVREKHGKVGIWVGLSPLGSTPQNPLDFQARQQMLNETFPDVSVFYIKDQASDVRWSKDLDGKVADFLTPSQTAVLYGSRDSFIPLYHGRYDTRELEHDIFISGTEIRKGIASKSTKGTADFRRGATWAVSNRYAAPKPTVDAAIVNEDVTQTLLAKKPGEDKWRFVGGFADVRSANYEQDCRREIGEETHIDVTDPVYIGNYTIDDWRFKNEADCIRTTLFYCKHVSGAPRPDDDIEALKWFGIDDLRRYPDRVVAEHQILLDAFIRFLDTRILKGTDNGS